jgi:osmotically-inducible protein OsmY
MIMRVILTSFFTLFLAACTTSKHTESTGEYFDSSAITVKVKASLLDELGSKGFSVAVETYKDEVLLSGFVDTIIIKQKAARIASGVDGVRVVRNNIVVKPS